MTTISALHCLHCGYNLTGLTENRCPECGQSFSIEELRAVQDQYAPSIRYTILNILLVPLLSTLMGAVMGIVMERVKDDSFVLLGWLVFIGFVIYTIIQSVKLAKRFAWQRAIRTQGQRPIREAKAFIIAMVLGLICCQAFLSAAGFFGGCFFGYLGTHKLNFH